MYLTLPLFALIVACGGGNEKKEEAGAVTAEVVDLSSNPDYQKGLELIGKSDCLTCHKVSEKNHQRWPGCLGRYPDDTAQFII